MASTKFHIRHRQGWFRLWIVATLVWIILVCLNETADPLQVEQVLDANVAADQLDVTKIEARRKADRCYSAPAIRTTPSWPEAYALEEAKGGRPLDIFLRIREANLPPEQYDVSLSCITKGQLWDRSIIGLGRALGPPVAVPLIAVALLWVINWIKAGFANPLGQVAQSDLREVPPVANRATDAQTAKSPKSTNAPRKRRNFAWYYYQFWNWTVLPFGWFLAGLGMAWKLTDRWLAASVVVGIGVSAVSIIFRWGSADDAIKKLD